MSKFYIMVTYHRIAVASADTREQIDECYKRLSEYEGYKGKMIILQLVDDTESNPYPFPDLDGIIDEEETHS